MAYDRCCKSLAEYFLFKHIIDKKAGSKDVESLATYIQTAVDDWFMEFERDRKVRAKEARNAVTDNPKKASTA